MIGGLILSGVVLVLTIAIKKWRHAIWGNVARFFRWLGTIRITTQRRIESTREEGRSEIRNQVANERESVPAPQWDIRPYDDDPEWFMLRNFGDGVRDISVIAPIDQFTFDASAHWDGFGAGVTGKQFKGHPLPAGKENGVTFTVRWRDANGDLQTTDVFSPPQGDAFESPAAAYERGRQDRQNEIDIERAVPLKKPRWLIVPNTQQRHGWVIMNNTTSDVVANHVSITADDNYFAFASPADWDSLPGGQQKAFLGVAREAGRHFGVHFTVEWSDANGDRWTETINATGGGVAGGYGIG